MPLHAQGSITIRRRPKDGNPGADAVRYWLVPSATQIKKTDDGKIYPSTITCEKRKQTGNSSPIVTSEGTIKYQIGYSDNSVSGATNYSSAITIPTNCQWIKFILYVNSVDVTTETVPVVSDGEDVFLLDLDNEMQGIPCKADGTPTVTGTLASTNSTVYKGASVDTGWGFSKQDIGCVSKITTNGTVSVVGITADNASVKVTATKNSKTLSAVMSLYKVRAGINGADGNDGVSPVVYSIESSVTAISKAADGTLNPTSFTAYKNKTVGATTTRTSEKTLKYKRVGQDSSEQTLSGEGGTIEDISSSCTSIALKIYDGSTVLDSETIPIVKDGQKGQDGTDGNDGADAVRYWLVPSATAINKSKGGTYSPSKVSCTVMKQVGSQAPVSETSLFVRYKIEYTSALVMTWTQYVPGTEKTISANTRSIKFELYTSGSAGIGATGNGPCIDTVTIPVVFDGQDGADGSDGVDGDDGLQGCILRMTEWNEGVEYHNDEALTSGTRFLDIAIITTGVTTFKAYQCLKTHTSSSSNAPGNATYWKEFNSMAPIYTPMIMAQYALLRIAQANQIQVMKDDGVTVNAALGGGKYPLWIGASQPQQAKFYVDEDGKAYMEEAEIIGRIIAGVVDGQRVELQPNNKCMKIYDSNGMEVASYEGNTYTSLSHLFSNKTGSFTMNTYKKGSVSLSGNNANPNNSKQLEYKASSSIQSDTPIEVVVSGYIQSYCTDPPLANTGSGSSIGVNPSDIMTPQMPHHASASLLLYVDTYSEASLTNRIGRTLIAGVSGSSSKTLSNVRAKTSVGGYHVISVHVYLVAVGSDQSAWVKWGSEVSNKSDISSTYTSDFYVSRYFANGFCLGQSNANYIWAYNQGTSGMRFIMENNGYGFDISNGGIKYRHHSGNWVNMPLFVFNGRAYNYTSSNNIIYSWASSKSFNSYSPTLSRVAEGQIKVTFPDSWINAGITPSSCMINVVGYGAVNGNSGNPTKAQILSTGSNYVTVTISDDASENDGSFYISIFTI